MGKKNKKPDFSGYKIFLLIGAVGAALAAAILAFLYFTGAGQKKEKKEDPGIIEKTDSDGTAGTE